MRSVKHTSHAPKIARIKYKLRNAVHGKTLQHAFRESFSTGDHGTHNMHHQNGNSGSNTNYKHSGSSKIDKEITNEHDNSKESANVPDSNGMQLNVDDHNNVTTMTKHTATDSVLVSMSVTK